MSWTAIVAMKRLGTAKSRLRGTLIGVDLDALVLAMAMDTVIAALSCPVVGRVVVVTPDPTVGAAATRLGAEVLSDVPDAGLNPALAYAATLVRPHGAAASMPGLVALTADLPALRPADLTEALHGADEVGGLAALPRRAFVADTPGTGTVLLAAPPGAALEPCFGPGSAAAHTASGAIALIGGWPSLRRDVDTATDLAEAVILGLGYHTARISTGPAIRAGSASGTMDPADPSAIAARGGLGRTGTEG